MIGVDEAGRGSWAGPLLAAAVRLRSDWSGRGLGDSKLLSPARRQELAGLLAAGEDFGLGEASVAEINEHGLSWAQTAAMSRAVGRLRPGPEEEIIVDGSVNYLAGIYAASRAVVKADRKHQAVMAASILAKTDRDRQMARFGRRYPRYGFGDHKGYGTKAHRAALAAHGPCALHRLSYKPVRALLTRSGPDPRA